MTKIQFQKYHGAGNDFIMIDARTIGETLFTSKLVESLCDRHFGIGGDGLILLLPSDTKDFYMKYFNSDGKEGSMCGNGGRCIAAFAKKLGIIGNETCFNGVDGEHIAYILESGQIRLKMIDVDSLVSFDDGYIINTGSPHFVIFIESLDETDVVSEGRSLRYEKRFDPGGANINFVKRLEANEIAVRTYERGVEDETLACGTGSVAAAIISHITGQSDKSEYLVHTQGGLLKVSFSSKGNHKFSDIWLEGPTKFVFEGEIKV